ncbi:hypothetical protein G6O67_006330 [Ophiocordyceps sinensis]|uniref:Uncharacterized protein n=1 Tax=Ophiocordyceps sinensis TaxID=72228 RepID=A0A8H4PKG3_9HYPO|nr:hypothetical protein G6O67_006330 [Ophiocordyceps sinensis]
MKFINVCALLAATAQAAPLLTDAVTQGVGGATGGASSLPGAGAGALKARQEEDAGEASQTLQQPAQSDKEGGLLGGILKARQVDGAADPIPADAGAADTGADAAADAGAADTGADAAADAGAADAVADADAADAGAADAGADAAQSAQAAPQQGGLGGLLRRSLEIRQEADAGAAAGADAAGADAADANTSADADAGADAAQQGGLGGLLRRSLETRQDDEADEAADA